MHLIKALEILDGDKVPFDSERDRYKAFMDSYHQALESENFKGMMTKIERVQAVAKMYGTPTVVINRRGKEQKITGIITPRPPQISQSISDVSHRSFIAAA